MRLTAWIVALTLWAGLLAGGAVFTHQHVRPNSCRTRYSADSCYALHDFRRDKRAGVS